MALTIGELVGYLRLDSTRFEAGLLKARRALKDAGDHTLTFGGHAAHLGAVTGATALKVGALAGAANLAAGAMSVLGKGLVTASGSLLLIPGAATAGAAAIGTLRVGLAGFGDALSQMDDPDKFAEAIADLAPAAQDAALALRELRPAWEDVQRAVANELFAGVGDELRQLGTLTLPVLREGMTEVAGSFNHAAYGVVRFLKQAQTLPDLAAIFRSTSTAVDNLGGATEPLLRAFRDIATVGAQLLPELTAGAGAAAERFAAFIAQARQSGQLAEWIRSGLGALSDLGAVLGNVGGIIAAVFAAASASGISTLSVLVEATGAAREFLRSAEGMRILGQIFGGIAAAGNGLRPVLAELGAAIVNSIAPAIARLGPMIGEAFRALAPAVAPFAAALAALAPVVGALALQVAGTLTAAIGALAPVVVALAPVVAQLAGLFGTALTGAIQAIAPALTTVTQALTPVLAQLATVVEQVLPTLLPLLGQVATTVAGVLVQALQILAPILPTLAAAFLQVIQAVMPIVPVLGQIITALLPPLAELVAALVPIITGLAGVFATLVPALLPLVELIANTAIPIIRTLLDVVTTVMGAIGPIITATMTVIRGVIETVMGLITGDWSRAWNGIKTVLSGVWEGIKAVLRLGRDIVVALFRDLPRAILGVLGDAASWLVNVGKDIVRGLINGIGSLARAIWDKIVGMVKAAWDAVLDFLGIGSPSRLAREAGMNIGRGLVLGVDKMSDRVNRAFTDMVAMPPLPKVVIPAPRLTTPAGLGSAASRAAPLPGGGDQFPVADPRATVHIEQFHATATHSPHDIATELDWLSRTGG